MENGALELEPRHLEQVGDYVRTHINEWMGEYDMVLRERVIRVEESIKSQLELMRLGFDQMDKRFEQVDKRFEQVDKRFEQVDKRFEQVDKRFEEVREDMNRRFDDQNRSMEARFVQVDKRLDRQFGLMSGFLLTLISGFIAVISILI